MPLSRRDFLQVMGVGTAAATALQFPLASVAFGEPRRVPPSEGAILLNSNENAYGPSEAVLAAMRNALSRCNRYPFSEYDALVDAIAAANRVKRDQVLLGCGSGELLKVTADTFTGAGKKLVTASPTFELIGAYAEDRGAQVTRVPLTAGFAHDLEAMLKEARAGAGLVYVCNPNNPTASLTARVDIESFIQKLPAETYVVVDEAYHHFAAGAPDYVSFLERPLDSERVIVLRTFSKIYGLAGLRVGYAVASAGAIGRMRPQQLQDNVNMIAALCAGVALQDLEGTEAAARRNAADRAEFMRQAARRTLRAIPSYANFVMIDSGRPVRKVIDFLGANQVLIGRPFPPLEKYARISLGTPPQMVEFWRVWDRMNAA